MCHGNGRNLNCHIILLDCWRGILAAGIDAKYLLILYIGIFCYDFRVKYKILCLIF